MEISGITLPANRCMPLFAVRGPTLWQCLTSWRAVVMLDLYCSSGSLDPEWRAKSKLSLFIAKVLSRRFLTIKSSERGGWYRGLRPVERPPEISLEYRQISSPSPPPSEAERRSRSSNGILVISLRAKDAAVPLLAYIKALTTSMHFFLCSSECGASGNKIPSGSIKALV